MSGPQSHRTGTIVLVSSPHPHQTFSPSWRKNRGGRKMKWVVYKLGPPDAIVKPQTGRTLEVWGWGGTGIKG
jgi:hypothetical protein